MAAVEMDTNLVQTQTDQSPIEPASPQMPISDGIITFIHIGFLIGWAITVFAYLSLAKETREAAREAKFKLLHGHKVPCYHCYFYSSNAYLKCAVRPTAVLTEQASDCADYQTQAPKKTC